MKRRSLDADDTKPIEKPVRKKNPKRIKRVKTRLPQRETRQPKRDLGKAMKQHDHSMHNLEPEWKHVFISNHAFDQFGMRHPLGPVSLVEMVKVIKGCVVYGRRSDKDSSLLDEIAPYVSKVSWLNRGRPVTLFMDDENFCCLVVREFKTGKKLLVLTCFMAC